MTILGHCGASYEEQMAMGDWQQVATLTGSGRSAMPARYMGKKDLAAVYVKNEVMGDPPGAEGERAQEVE